MMKILILGAGGVGGYFGAHLLQAGADITYLVRSQRKALIDKHGLKIETPQTQFVVHTKTVTAADVKSEYDLIILAPKSYDLDDAIQSIKGALDQGVVLPFLNGLDHLEKLDTLLSKKRVMGGVAHIAATLTNDGAVRQLTDMHRLTIGARHASHEKLAIDFAELCKKAPFDSALSNDIEQVLWDKWVFLATLAGMTTLCRASVGDIVATPYGKMATIDMYEECCLVAKAYGHPISEQASTKALEMLTAPGSSFTASMLRDLQDGKRTEHNHILGAMIMKGEKMSCQTPLMKIAHTHIEISGKN